MLLLMENRAEDEGTVSLRADVPEPLLQAMREFIEVHPNWDQYRLFQAALAGFLVQNGVKNRGITRCYLANLFPSQQRFRSPSPPRTAARDDGDTRPLSPAVPAIAGPSRQALGESTAGCHV